MSIFHWLRGTLEQFFNVGGAGTAANPAWRNNAGVMESRRGDDSGFGLTRGADALGDDDYITRRQFAAGVSFFAVAFGRNTAVPGMGSLQLKAPGDSFVGYRTGRVVTLTGGSIHVNTPDGVRSYNMDIRINGVSAATVPLVAGAVGAHTAALAVPVAAGSEITAFVVLTAGVGASTFTQETALVEFH